MGKIVVIIGKSSSGKDTIYNEIKNDNELKLKTIVPYTTRPIRDGETEGVEYHFVSVDEFNKFNLQGKVVEYRVYHTAHGDWTYFTVKDDINLADSSYVVIGTLESYEAFKDYFGEDKLVPIYIEVDDGIRLERALKRELCKDNRRFKEMCRRFLADCDDFAEEKIEKAGIDSVHRIENIEIASTVKAVKELIIRSI